MSKQNSVQILLDNLFYINEIAYLIDDKSWPHLRNVSHPDTSDVFKICNRLFFYQNYEVSLCDVMLVESGEALRMVMPVDGDSVIHEYELEFYCTLNLCTSDTLKNLWSLDSQLLNAFWTTSSSCREVFKRMKRGLLRKVQTGRLHRFLVSHFQVAAAFESSPHQIFDFLFKSSVVLSLLRIWCPLHDAVKRDPLLIVLICVWLWVHWSFYTFCIYSKILTDEIWT